jgi:hypothetical protein
MHSFFATKSPSKQQNLIGDISVLDLDPQYFYLIGKFIPQDFEGGVIKSILQS